MIIVYSFLGGLDFCQTFLVSLGDRLDLILPFSLQPPITFKNPNEMRRGQLDVLILSLAVF